MSASNSLSGNPSPTFKISLLEKVASACHRCAILGVSLMAIYHGTRFL